MSAYKAKNRKDRLLSKTRSGMANEYEIGPMGENEGGQRAEMMLEGEERVFKMLRKEITERCAQVGEKADQGEVWPYGDRSAKEAAREVTRGVSTMFHEHPAASRRGQSRKMPKIG